jgi:hypothetical protein
MGLTGATGPVNGNLQLDAQAFAYKEDPPADVGDQVAYFDRSSTTLTFYGNNNVGVYAVDFTYPVSLSDIIINTIDLNGQALVSGKTMFLINTGARAAALGDTTGNVRCPGAETLAPNEGVILEYFGTFWYCMEKRLL